jgi:glutathione S-transferase
MQSSKKIQLVIGDKNLSSWSLRPWLFMKQMGVAFDEIPLPLDTPEFEQRIGQYSPTRRVPVLNIDDETVWDSLAICEVVNERYCDGRGWPSDPRPRAAARSAVAEMHSGFTSLRQQLPMEATRQPNSYRWKDDAQRDIDRVQQLWRDLKINHGAGGDFLCGEFGIVDAFFAPVAYRFRGYGVEHDKTAADFMRALFALPAMREWQAGAEAEVSSERG